MRITLIGSGYVGSYLLNNWNNREDRFIPITTTPIKIETLKEFEIVEEAILAYDRKKLAEAILNSRVVIVCAAPKQGNYQEAYLDTAKFVHGVIQHIDHPLYLLYTSSTSVYGKQQSAWVDEQSPLYAESSESEILIETERMYLACVNQWVSVCILRLGGIYGPKRSLRARAETLSGKEIPGSGKQPTNHSHIEDIGKGIAFCVKNELKGIYNLVADAHPLREDLYRELCEIQGLPPPAWNPHQSALHGSKACVSNEKIKAAGFRFNHLELDLMTT